MLQYSPTPPHHQAHGHSQSVNARTHKCVYKLAYEANRESEKAFINYGPSDPIPQPQASTFPEKFVAVAAYRIRRCCWVENLMYLAIQIKKKPKNNLISQWNFNVWCGLCSDQFIVSNL